MLFMTSLAPPTPHKKGGSLWSPSLCLAVNATPGLGDGAMAAVLKAMGVEGACPDLRLLQINETNMKQAAGKALLKALRDKAWPKLNELILWDNPGLKVGVGLGEVLEAGGGQALERLDTQNTGMTGKGARRLCEALRRGACPMLYDLKVDDELRAADSGVDWQGALGARTKKMTVH